MKMNLNYYSERGLVNTLINWIKDNSDNIDTLNKFFNLLGVNLGNESVIDIYDEISFGQFGSPDLIIRVDNRIFIIEAKINTFVKSATSEKDKSKFKDNASKINIQLLLRYRFVKALYTNKNSEEIIDNNDDNDNGIYAKGRALKKKELVKLSNKIFKDIQEENIYYVALVKEDTAAPDIYKKYFEDTGYELKKENFIIITWEDIDNKIGQDVLKKTWEYTDADYDKNIN